MDELSLNPDLFLVPVLGYSGGLDHFAVLESLCLLLVVMRNDRVLRINVTRAVWQNPFAAQVGATYAFCVPSAIA